MELETDKVSVEVPAPASGVLSEVTVKEGDTVAPGGLLGMISEGGAAATSAPAAKPAALPPLRHGSRRAASPFGCQDDG